MMNKISVVIITFNEEKNIERCLLSIQDWVDEIIIIDSDSIDKTPTICKKYKVNFTTQKWLGYAATKNFANTKASHQYILSLDADEAVSETLKKAILKEQKQGLKGVYSFNRLTNYCGKWIKYSGWYPDKKTRLFPKQNTIWEGDFVHETLKLPPKITMQHLQGDLLHYSYYTFEEHRQRADKYSLLTAKKMKEANQKPSLFKPAISFISRFVGMYFIKKGFLDGKMGWVIAKTSARSNYLKYKELNRLWNV